MYKDNQERVDAYLRGEMDMSERREFESDIKTDSNLHADYLETKAILEALADRCKKISQMNQWDMEEKQRIHDELHKKKLRLWITTVSSAACIVAFFFMIKSIIISPSVEHGFVMPDFSEAVSSNIENSGIDVLDSLITNHAYKDALAFADLLIEENQHHIDHINIDTDQHTDEFDIVYYGQTDSVSGDISNKYKVYEDIIYATEWRRINLILALGEREQCIEDLRRFIQKEGVYQKQALKLLETLNE